MRPIDADEYERELLYDMALHGEQLSGDAAYNRALVILTQMPTLAPPNEPLTLDELLKMDGQPVYVVFRPDSSGERSQSWALVNVDEKYSEVYLVDSIPGASCYYDEVWADLEGIYRRPPEGAGNA